MKNRCPLISLVIVLTATALAAGQAELPEYQKREFKVADGKALKYVVYVPKGLTADKPVPLLIYLHGSSADCVTHERILKESNLQFWHAYGRNVQSEPTILMAPVGGQGGWTGPSREKAVLGIIDGLLEEFPVDRRRIYLQGFSMGGGGTWHFLQKRPGFFAAANPQALGARELDAQKIKDTPLWATIGSKDRSLARMKENVAAVRAANGDNRGALTEVMDVNPRFTIFADTDHGGAQVATQKIPGFKEWMYAQVNDKPRSPAAEGASNETTGGEKAAEDWSKWEESIAKFEEFDRRRLPPKNHLLFAGASSVVMWKLNDSYPEWRPINRGFGGSLMREVTHFADRTILKHEPQVIVLYCGENDIARGGSPDALVADFQKFVEVVHGPLPQTTIVFLAIKPTRLRWRVVEEIKESNAKIKALCEKSDRLEFVDTFTPILGKDGLPRTELFQDAVHLNADGYKLWEAALNPVLERVYRPAKKPAE